ncbi:hypothetical protein OG21DRAFT_1605373 [Imleria badia]|nr:hypothetical protein OG21DRAFT_1605373 [Imleria badia]
MRLQIRDPGIVKASTALQVEEHYILPCKRWLCYFPRSCQVQHHRTFSASPPSPPRQNGTPSLASSFPSIQSLTTTLPTVHQPNHYPALEINWARDVLMLVDHPQQIAVPLAVQIASAQHSTLIPIFAEAIYLRATFAARYVWAWFRLDRDYENFNNATPAHDRFKRGVKLNVVWDATLDGPTCSPEIGLPLIHHAVTSFHPDPHHCKLGHTHTYESALPPFLFGALLSVQYWEVKADTALSKWFLCGAEGTFDQDENLAFKFAERRVCYGEIGVGGTKDIGAARMWYQLADHGNADTMERLAVLSQLSPQSLSREEHDTITEFKLVRKRTQAKQRSERTRRVMGLLVLVWAPRFCRLSPNKRLLRVRWPQSGYGIKPGPRAKTIREPASLHPHRSRRRFGLCGWLSPAPSQGFTELCKACWTTAWSAYGDYADAVPRGAPSHDSYGRVGNVRGGSWLAVEQTFTDTTDDVLRSGLLYNQPEPPTIQADIQGVSHFIDKQTEKGWQVGFS